MEDVVLALASAFFGAFAAFLASLYLTRISERPSVTHALVNEFYSDGFMAHRVSLSSPRRKVQAGSTTIDDVACGFWYPGSQGPAFTSYRGDITAGLDEHQHIEAYIGFVVRLDHALSQGLVDKRYVGSTLSQGMMWHIGILVQLAEAATSQAKAEGGQMPDWARAVRTVREALAVNSKAIPG